MEVYDLLVDVREALASTGNEICPPYAVILGPDESIQGNIPTPSEKSES